MRTSQEANSIPAQDLEMPLVKAVEGLPGCVPFPDARGIPEDSSEKFSTYSWVLAGFPLWAPLRVLLRFSCAVLWIALCYIAFGVASALLLVSKPMGRSARKTISRLWIYGMRGILGIRIKWMGQPPSSPYFMVCNHLSWQDLFVMNCLCDVSCVVQAEDEKLPFVGTLITGMRPIFHRRTRENVFQTIAKMVETIHQGRNLLLAPEGVVGPGREVRRFHAALLDAAIQTGRPVHYLSLTYRTPKGCPPPSKAALFGPDPFLRTPDGRIPESELEAWGPERSFLTHFLGVLALPWHEVIVRFAGDPISATDRVTLANRLRESIQSIFTPVE